MKIHFVISTLGGGGAERVLTLMANSLAKNEKNEISILTLFETKENYPLHPLVKKIELKRIKYFPSHTLRSIINLSRFYRKKSNRPDIIVSFVTLTNFIAIIVAKLYSIKIIAQEHNSHLRFMKGRRLSTNFTKKYLYKKADLLTVLTSYDVEFYEKYGAKVYVMPNPCSFNSITDNSHKRKKVILAVGHLDRYHHKGLDNLIRLIAPILKENLTWKLKIAGSGKKGMKYLSNLANEYGIEESVVFTGFVNNISKLMYESSIFILPSRFEGLPMVLLEAMSQGMACIAYNCKTGPSDIIDNGINGILIEDQDEKEMQVKLRQLIKDEGLRRRLSKEGISSLDKYEISTITQRYEDIFNDLLKE